MLPLNQRFVVGIDLGTTNCALAWADTSATGRRRSGPRCEQIPQLVNAGEVQRRGRCCRRSCTSPARSIFPPAAPRFRGTAAPAHVVGELARRRGAENPMRLVASAKSWLSYAGANRTAPILPWGARRDVPQLSPVDASAEYLRHLRAAWDARRRARRVGDARGAGRAHHRAGVVRRGGARAHAARRRAGGPRARHAARGAAGGVLRLARRARATGGGRRVSVGDLMLVCDVGGGTTDFSLIAVVGGATAISRSSASRSATTSCSAATTWTSRSRARAAAAARGRRPPHRHLAAARPVAPVPRSRRRRCSPTRRQTERPVTLLGRGSRLIGGTMTTSLTRDDVDQVLRRRVLPGGRGDDDAGTAAARRPPGARAAVRGRSGGDPSPRAVPDAAGRRGQRLCGGGPARAERAGLSRRTCSSTAA